MNMNMQTVPSPDCCTCFKLGFQNYAKCTGRSRRSEFWYFHIMVYIIYCVLYGILISNASRSSYQDQYSDPYSSSSSSPNQGIMILFYILCIFMLLVIIPSISLTVRRLHDTGRSGFYYFISFIPMVGPLILIILCCQDSEYNANEYGISPKYILPQANPLNPPAVIVQPVVQVPVNTYPQPQPQPQPYPPVSAYPPQPAPMPTQMGPYPQAPPQGFAPY